MEAGFMLRSIGKLMVGTKNNQQRDSKSFKMFKAENDEGSFIVSSFFVQSQATQTKLSKAIHASANIRI